MINSVNDIKTIGVIGAGTMGQGIAQIAAMAGMKVILFDIDATALNRSVVSIKKNLDKGIEKGKVTEGQRDQTLLLIASTSDLAEVKADFIIEAIIENLEVKRKVLADVEAGNGDGCILATNTSSIPVTQVAAKLQRPERLVGMHFFNPAHIMKLVEVVSGAATDEHIAALTFELARKWNKVPVYAADSPGFIVNRVARHFYVEGLKVLEEGVCDEEGIDKLMKASGFKMGPFELMDLIGVDTNFSVTKSMFDAFYQDPKFRPSRIQQQKVDAGHHGRKSGKGFYDYS